MNAPAVDKAFRATYTPRSGVSAVSANILITADDYFTLYVNGQVVGDTRSQIGTGTTVWANVHGYSVDLNIDGTAPIVFGIIVSNQANSAAGLLAAMRLSLSDGSTATISSGGGAWRSTSSIPQNFAAPGLDDSGWSTPAILSKNGASQPWGPIQVPTSLTDVSLSPSQGTSPSAGSTTKTPPNPTTAPTSGTTTPPPDAVTTVTSTGGVTGSNSSGTSNGGSNAHASSSLTLNGIGANKSSGSLGPSATQISGPASSGLSGNDTTAGLPAQSGSHTPVGAIAGGVVGGVVVILLLILLWFFFRRRSQHSVAATIPPTSEAQDPGSSAILSTRPRPFTAMMGSSHNRTGSSSSDNASRAPIRKGTGGFGYQNMPSPSPPSVTSDGSRAEDLGATLAKLQELTAELNRGLADQGVNAPRIALTVAAPQEAGGQSIIDGHGNGQLPPPYIEERRHS
ncbi:hypothetical protein H0H87_006776 [Tephrocybe sp. NHM501043]|nr:hypothetical protein H0H87_006776 [Tephrocybe sp. NHM501043]